ncbi:MSC_0624 family F1-like ATPase-associated membrane protein [Mycoplasmopsis hyopharyngis]|uniref:MSC_0624 family F1-like ATPase-associated membrane protein n=1 Tax=Mycoplasmopsis hyopharyngis TaxID=29558 RepID=UPI00387373F7
MQHNSSILDSNKIFDDNQTLTDEKKRNRITIIYKTLLLSFFFISFLTLLITSKQSLFDKKHIGSLYNFLMFEIFRFEQMNWVFIFRICVLGFVYFYSLFKAYLCINKTKENIRLYAIWFSLYWAMSIIAFVLFLSFFTIFSIKVINLIYLLVPLWALDVSYILFLFFTKRKVEPIVYGKTWPLYVDIASRTLLLIITISIFLKWVNSGGEYHTMLSFNSFYTSVLDLFKTKSFGNLIAVLLLFIAFGTLILGTKIYAIWSIANKQYNLEYFKDKVFLYMIFLGITIIWFFQLFGIKIPDQNILNDEHIVNYWFVLFGIFNCGIFALYVVFLYLKQFKTRSNLVRTLYLSFFQWIIWILFLISNFVNEEPKVNIINLFFTTIVALLMFYFYFKKTKTYNFITSLFLLINIVLIISVILLFGFNQVLLSEDNKIFYVINSKLSLMQLMTIVIISFITIFVSYSLVSIFLVMRRISTINNSPELREEKNENKNKQEAN